MTKPREKTREELTAEIEESKKKIRQFENREKIIKQKTAYEISLGDWSSDVCSSDLFFQIFPYWLTRQCKPKKRGGFLVGHVLCFRHNAFKDRAPDDKAVAARSAFLFG